MPDEFEAATHAELARIVASVKVSRRKFPEHRACPDGAACKFCTEIRTAHLLLNDHRDQLEGIDSTCEVESLPDLTQNRECGCCGRTRYRGFRGAVICLACDGFPVGSWVGMNGETVE